MHLYGSILLGTAVRESIAQEDTGLSLLFSERPRNPDRLLAIYTRPLCHLAETLIKVNNF